MCTTNSNEAGGETRRGSDGQPFPDTCIEDLRNQAIQNHKLGKYVDAARLFKQAFDEFGASSDSNDEHEQGARARAGLLCNASACYLLARDTNLSQSCAEQAGRVMPTWSKPYLRKGEAYAAAGDFERAITDFKECIALCLKEQEEERQKLDKSTTSHDDTTPNTMTKHSCVAIEAEEKLRAAEKARALTLELSEEDESELSKQKKQNDADKGIRELEEAAEERERLPAAKSSLDRATKFLKEGDSQECIRELQAAFSHDSSCWQAAFQCGSLLWRHGCPVAALHWYYKGLMSEPRFIQGHIMVFGLLRRLGYQADEVSEANLGGMLSSSIAPAHLDLSLSLAQCLFMIQGRAEDAAEVLRAALKGPIDGRARPGTVLRENKATTQDWFSQGMVEFYLAYIMLMQGYLGEPMALLLLVAEHLPITIPYLTVMARCASVIGENSYVKFATESLRQRLKAVQGNEIGSDRNANPDQRQHAIFETAEINTNFSLKEEIVAELLTFHEMCSLPQLSILSDKTEVAQCLQDRESHCVPPSFLWPEQSRPLQRIIQSGLESVTDKDDCFWIVRPSYPVMKNNNNYMSDSIQMCTAKICTDSELSSAAQNLLLEQRKAIPKCGQVLVQKYINRPLLLHGCKFTLRFNVVLLRLEPEPRVYLSSVGDVHVCESKYRHEKESHGDSETHFTCNSTRGSPSQQFHRRISNDAPQHTFQDLKVAFGMENWISIWEHSSRALKSLMPRVITNLKQTHSEASAFAHGSLGIPSMIGFDVLIDEEYKPWVLRVRHKIPESISLATKAEKETMLNAWLLAEELLLDELHLKGTLQAEEHNIKQQRNPEEECNFGLHSLML